MDLHFSDMAALHAVYNACFPSLRTDCATLRQRLGLDSGSRLLVRTTEDGTAAGFAVVRADALLLLCVAPEHQNRGIGSALLTEAEALLTPHGRAVLGHAPDTYIFPGVPMDSQTDAHAFFEKRGYHYSWTACDLLLDLTAYAHQPSLDCRDPRLRTRLRTPKDCAAAGRCGAEIGGFGTFFAELPDMLLAEWDGAIIGGCGAHLARCLYTEALPDASTFGPLGVLEAYRGRGVGMRLCQDALDRLQAQGAKQVHIGYTWLEDWYGKLGAKRCMDYWMGEKTL